MVQGYWAYMENNFHERMEQFLTKIVTVNASCKCTNARKIFHIDICEDAANI